MADRRMNRLKELHHRIDDVQIRRLFEKLTEAVLAELISPGHDRLGRVAVFWDNEEEAAYYLNSLDRELERGGYRMEAGRLVAEDIPATGPDVDRVTGIGNRAYLEVEAARIWGQCRREGLRCSTIFVDIDRFKVFNDQHGHATGDAILRAVAQAFQKAIQLRGGVVGRYGGEEIVATMPNLDESEVKSLGERVRQEVERLRVDRLSVTVSVGVASIEASTSSLETLWDMADQSLLRAKSGGRNKTVAYSELAGNC